ncbi:MAG: acyl-CoA dehydratase activase [Desulfobacteraceae bacterium]|jgi:predicted CoA-substrate-specific enzyme activase
MAAYFAGIDIGSTMTKAVILDEGIIASVIGPTGPEYRRLANKVMEETLNKASLHFESITYIVSTGYGRISVPFADKQVTEISCHARGIASLFPKARTVIDIGGQDSKAISIGANGRPTNFIMNDKCAAGSGRFIEVIADSLGIKLEDIGDISLKSNTPANISNICTIWAQQEVAARLAEGVPVPDLVAGIHESLADRVARMVKRLKVEKEVILTGGGGKNKGLVQALSEQLGCEIWVPPEPLITGALGAALLGKDMAEKARKSNEPLETKERILEEVEIF